MIFMQTEESLIVLLHIVKNAARKKLKVVMQGILNEQKG